MAVLSLNTLMDVQKGLYEVTINVAQNNNIAGPLSGILPQTNEIQQWVLIGLTLILGCLLGLLVRLWWLHRRQIKEKP